MRILIAGVILLMGVFAQAQERVAILGDSVTHHGRWATWVESALLETVVCREAEIVNFGLGSETVSGLSEEGYAEGRFPRPDAQERLGRVLEQFQPNLVLAWLSRTKHLRLGVREGLPMAEAEEKARELLTKYHP